MSPSPIVLLTDFGVADWYVAEMKGVLATLAPSSPLHDLSHDVPPGDVAHGAFLLARAHGTWPAGTVFLAVVDPGVGTERHPLAVQAAGRYYVGPDNGLLEAALDQEGAEARVIEDAALLAAASRTFHGRDVFAPIAARLATGGAEAFAAVGRVLGVPARLEPVHAGAVDRSHADLVAEIARGSRLATRVAHVDRFGNVILHLRGNALLAWLGNAAARDLVVRAHGAGGAKVTVVRGLAETYAGARPAGQPFALIGSSGLLEIALAGGHAALTLGLAPGDAVNLTLEPRG